MANPSALILKNTDPADLPAPATGKHALFADSTNYNLPAWKNSDGSITTLVGPAGSQGLQGTQGVTGSQGNQGAQGTAGAQGTQGTAGAQGNQGAQGAQGSQGTQGIQGVQGSQGNQGTAGSGVSGLTAGRIPIVATSTTLGDSANLFWDSSTASLNIGAGTPAATDVGYFRGTNASGRIAVKVENTSNTGSTSLQLFNDSGQVGLLACSGSAYVINTFYNSNATILLGKGSVGLFLGTSSATPIILFTGAETAASERMRIDSSLIQFFGNSNAGTAGNQSIRTYNNSTNAAAVAANYVLNNNSDYVGLIITSSAATGNLYAAGVGVLQAKLDLVLVSGDAGAAKSIIFATGGNALSNERMRIDATGVGIGTLATPAQKLHVSQTTNANVAIEIETTSNGTAARSNLRLHTDEGLSGSLFATSSGWSASGNTVPSQLVISAIKAGGMAISADHASGVITMITGGTATTNVRLTLDAGGNVVCGNAAIATNATDGFLYIPTCAGIPSGTPTAKTGRCPIVFDTSNNNLYLYDGGWIKVALA